MELGYSASPAYIQPAIVTEVFAQDYQVSVVTINDQMSLKKISYGTPYVSGRGKGINFVPEIGAFCWVMAASSQPSSRTAKQGFVIAWQPANTQGGSGSSGNRPPLFEGDILMSTRAENSLLLESNGSISIEASPLARTLYLPVQGVISHLFANYKMVGAGGEFKWTVKEGEQENGSPVTWAYGIKEISQDTKAFVELKAGKREGGLTVSVFEDGTAESREMEDGRPTGLSVEWSINKEGNFQIYSAELFSVDAGNISLTSEQNITLNAGDIAEMSQKILKIRSSVGTEITSPNISIVCGNFSIKSPSGVVLFEVKDGVMRGLVTENFLATFAAHTHQPVGGGATFTGPPDAPFTLAILDSVTTSKGIK